MTAARFGYRLGLLTTLVMVGAAVTAGQWAAARADDVQAYAVFAGIGAGATILASWRFGAGTLWGFLVPAFLCHLAGIRGLPLFWLFAVGYAVAGGIGLWAAWVVPDVPPLSIRPRGHHRHDDGLE